MLGGAACGKTAVLRERYVGDVQFHPQGDSRAVQPKDGFADARRFDPDDFKEALATYSPAAGDDVALERFENPHLGGPSGPKNSTELELYPDFVQRGIAETLSDLGYESAIQFAQEIINEDGSETFGGGLTHELSKFMAAAAFEEELAKGPAGGSLIWDATGNTERYVFWIEKALDLGFDVEIIYVTCSLHVALMRAAKRVRKVPAAEVRRTHAKAAGVANDLEIMAGSHPSHNRILFHEIPTSSEGELKEASDGGFGET